VSHHTSLPFGCTELQTSAGRVSEGVGESRRMSAFTSRGTCRLLPVSTATNKPTVATYKYNLHHPPQFLSDERAPRNIPSLDKNHSATTDAEYKTSSQDGRRHDHVPRGTTFPPTRERRTHKKSKKPFSRAPSETQPKKERLDDTHHSREDSSCRHKSAFALDVAHQRHHEDSKRRFSDAHHRRGN
jgi:hypothetical protein